MANNPRKRHKKSKRRNPIKIYNVSTNKLRHRRG